MAFQAIVWFRVVQENRDMDTTLNQLRGQQVYWDLKK